MAHKVIPTGLNRFIAHQNMHQVSKTQLMFYIHSASHAASQHCLHLTHIMFSIITLCLILSYSMLYIVISYSIYHYTYYTYYTLYILYILYIIHIIHVHIIHIIHNIHHYSIYIIHHNILQCVILYMLYIVCYTYVMTYYLIVCHILSINSNNIILKLLSSLLFL